MVFNHCNTTASRSNTYQLGCGSQNAKGAMPAPEFANLTREAPKLRHSLPGQQSCICIVCKKSPVSNKSCVSNANPLVEKKRSVDTAWAWASEWHGT